ncbi:MAG: hypothetical protein H7836_13180 [Magnetococcus sp. YQC-3]
MEDWEKEAQKNMFEIDRILSKFWTDGWMSSYTKQKIWDEFPPRLKNLLFKEG